MSGHALATAYVVVQYLLLYFKKRDSVTRFFASGFFHESVSPQPQSIPFRPFRIFSSRCTTGINDTGGKFTTGVNDSGGKLSATPVANFSTIFSSVVDTGGKFATGVNDTGSKFATGVNDAGGKLPPVSTTPAANLPPMSTTPVANNVQQIRLQTP
jgi:hypothetical protein